MENTRGHGLSKSERSGNTEQGRNQQTGNSDQQSQNRGSQNPSRSGGLTDMTSTSNNNSRRGSSITEKRGVTGSEYDGQISEE